MATENSTESLLTVVTPTILGREAFLEECIASVEAQSPSVDHKIWLDLNREGPAAIRNKLVATVSTPWVLFLDDDDFLDDDYCKTVLPFLTEEHDVVYTWCKSSGPYPVSLDFDFDPEGLLRDNYIPVTACVRVDKFREVGGFPEGVAYEDWGLWVAILNSGGTFKLIRKKKWTYRRHDGSATWQNQQDIASGRRAAR